MKNVLLILLSCCLFSFHKVTLQGTFTNLQQKDSTWIDSFREFRDAVYHNDRAKVKTFFNFPIATGNNDIWYLAYGGDSKKIDKLTDKPNPFTEKDFDRYFESVFSKYFINAILKIKSDILYKTGKSETVSFKGNGKATYRMFATFDKAEHELRLNLLTSTMTNDDEEGYEHSDIYLFEVINNRQLRFKNMMGAD